MEEPSVTNSGDVEERKESVSTKGRHSDTADELSKKKHKKKSKEVNELKLNEIEYNSGLSNSELTSSSSYTDSNKKNTSDEPSKQRKGSIFEQMVKADKMKTGLEEAEGAKDSGDKEPRRDRKGSTHTKDTSYKDTAHKDTSHNKDTGHKDSGHKDSGHKDSTHKDSTHKEEGSSSKHYNSNTLKKEVFGAHHQLFDEDKSSKDKDNNKKGGGFKKWMAALFGMGKKEKQVEEEPSLLPSDEELDVQCFADLPKELQKMVSNAKIVKDFTEEEFDILLNVLHFQTKLKFTRIEQKKREMRAMKFPPVPPPKSANRPITNPDLLMTAGNPKDIYKMLHEEGKGGFGTVFKGYKRQNEREKVAIKIMPHSTPKEKKFNYAEVSFLNYCKHPNIVKYIASYEVDNSIWMIMEFLEGGTLDQAVKSYNFNEKQIAYVAKEMLKGIQYLHSENLVHRDLKSANVMMSITAEIKLIDFGLCVDVSDGSKCSMVGSPFWMPPEMIQRKPHDHKVDIWSLGISLVELANGEPPNLKSSIRAMYTVGTEGLAQPLDKPKQWSDSFKDFLSLCLQMDPSKRPTSEQLANHEFLKQADTRKNMQKLLAGIFVLNAVLPF